MAELAIIAPTLDEHDNIEPFLEALDRSLAGYDWEVVFVDDDSSDGTTELLRHIAQDREDVRLVHRVGRRGLSSAVIEGVLATSAPFIAVIDTDLQHDESLLVDMLDRHKAENLDVVVATRFGEGASIGDTPETRQIVSAIANRLSRLVVRERLTDPLSGFFMMRRDFFDEVVHRLSGYGFKILIDLFASAERPVRFAELPFRFRGRHAGASKLSPLVLVEYGELLADKIFGRIIPIRFMVFVGVGGFGVFVHLAVLGLIHIALAQEFLLGQTLATLVAMTVNFFLNNVLTYRDRKLHGLRLLRGLLLFYLVCGAGAVINLQVAKLIFDLGAHWAFAGLVGAGVSSVWNFAVTSTFTWTQPRRVRKR